MEQKGSTKQEREEVGMKTVKPNEKGGVPERKSDEIADNLVKTGKWVHCKKTEWKSHVRDRAKLEAEAAEKARKAEKKEQPKDTAKDKPRRR